MATSAAHPLLPNHPGCDPGPNQTSSSPAARSLCPCPCPFNYPSARKTRMRRDRSIPVAGRGGGRKAGGDPARLPCARLTPPSPRSAEPASFSSGLRRRLENSKAATLAQLQRLFCSLASAAAQQPLLFAEAARGAAAAASTPPSLGASRPLSLRLARAVVGFAWEKGTTRGPPYFQRGGGGSSSNSPGFRRRLFPFPGGSAL